MSNVIINPHSFVSEFAPDSISDLHAWYKSDTNVTVINDGTEDRVSRWGDVDDAQPLEQAGVNARPRRIDATHAYVGALNSTDLQNGYPYITATGGTSVLGAFSSVMTDPFTIVLVRKISRGNGGAYAYMYSKNSGTSGAGETIRSLYGLKTMSAIDTSGGGGSFTVTRYIQTTSFDVWIQVYDGANSASYFNGAANGTGTTPSPIEHDGLTLIYGSFLEVICYDKALSVSEIADLNTYLTDKYTETTFKNRWSTWFDGINDYVSCGNITALNGSGTATWAGWVKPENAATGETPFSQYGTSGDRQFSWFVTSSRTRIDVFMNGNVVFRASGGSDLLDADVWNFVAITYNKDNVAADEVKVYVGKGGSIARVTETGSFTGDNAVLYSTTSDFLIGSMDEGSPGRFWEGNVDNVGIWDVELDLSTVTSLYNSEVPNDLRVAASYTSGSGVDKSGDLQGYWQMGEGSFYNGGSSDVYTIPDDSTNSNTGTLKIGFDGNMKMDTSS